MIESDALTDDKSVALAYKQQFIVSEKLINTDREIKGYDKKIKELEEKIKSEENKKEIQESINDYKESIKGELKEKHNLQQELAELNLKIESWEDNDTLYKTVNDSVQLFKELRKQSSNEEKIKYINKEVAEINQSIKNDEQRKKTAISFLPGSKDYGTNDITKLKESLPQIKELAKNIKRQSEQKTFLESELKKIEEEKENAQKKEMKSSLVTLKAEYILKTKNADDEGKIGYIQNKIIEIEQEKLLENKAEKWAPMLDFLESKLKEVGQEIYAKKLKAIEENEKKYKEKLNQTLEELNNILGGAIARIQKKPENEIEENPKNILGDPIAAYKNQYSINNKLNAIKKELTPLKKTNEKLDEEIKELELKTKNHYLSDELSLLKEKKEQASFLGSKIENLTARAGVLGEELKKFNAQIENWESSVLQEKDDGMLARAKALLNENGEFIYKFKTLLDTSEGQLKDIGEKIQEINKDIEKKESEKESLIRNIATTESSQKQEYPSIFDNFINFFTLKTETESLEELRKVVKDIKEKNDEKEFLKSKSEEVALENRGEMEGDIKRKNFIDKARDLLQPPTKNEKKRNTDIHKAEEFYSRANDLIKKPETIISEVNFENLITAISDKTKVKEVQDILSMETHSTNADIKYNELETNLKGILKITHASYSPKLFTDIKNITVNFLNHSEEIVDVLKNFQNAGLQGVIQLENESKVEIAKLEGEFEKKKSELREEFINNCNKFETEFQEKVKKITQECAENIAKLKIKVDELKQEIEKNKDESNEKRAPLRNLISRQQNGDTIDLKEYNKIVTSIADIEEIIKYAEENISAALKQEESLKSNFISDVKSEEKKLLENLFQEQYKLEKRISETSKNLESTIKKEESDISTSIKKTAFDKLAYLSLSTLMSSTLQDKEMLTTASSLLANSNIQSMLAEYVKSSEQVRTKVENFGIDQGALSELLPNVLSATAELLKDFEKLAAEKLSEIAELRKTKPIKNGESTKQNTENFSEQAKKRLRQVIEVKEERNEQAIANKIIELKAKMIELEDKKFDLIPAIVKNNKIHELAKNPAAISIVDAMLKNNSYVKEQLDQFGISKELITGQMVLDFTSVALDIFKSPCNNTTTIDEIFPQIKVLLGKDLETDEHDKAKHDAFLKVADTLLLQNDHSNLIASFITKNSEALTGLVNHVMKHNGLDKKLSSGVRDKVGDILIDALKKPENFTIFKNAYETYRNGSPRWAGIKLAWDIQGMKGVGEVLSVIWKETMPNFWRRWTAGKDVATVMNKQSEEKDLNKIFSNASKEGLDENAIYSLDNKLCKGLRFYKINFVDCKIDGFDMRDVRFGDKKDEVNGPGVSFQGSTISNTDFSGARLRGPVNLEDVTIDSKSLISLLPSLDAAIKNEQKVPFSNIKINNYTENDRKIIKESEFGKQLLDHHYILKEQENSKNGHLIVGTHTKELMMNGVHKKTNDHTHW